jgi:hypothetical protein
MLPKPRTHQNLLLYTFYLPSNKINYLPNNQQLDAFLDVFYRVLILFFKEKYPKVSEEFIIATKDDLDMDYLNSIPYPALYEEQLFDGDQ